jgi:hypothetical protein
MSAADTSGDVQSSQFLLTSEIQNYRFRFSWIPGLTPWSYYKARAYTNVLYNGVQFGANDSNDQYDGFLAPGIMFYFASFFCRRFLDRVDKQALDLVNFYKWYILVRSIADTEVSVPRSC